ncbi:MAG: hypothetical protein EA388_05500 [Nitriliruptor sp.]|nr:MAG: hypothetical protein EA388_05500 [Nitriliruptor sp.]
MSRGSGRAVWRDTVPNGPAVWWSTTALSQPIPVRGGESLSDRLEDNTTSGAATVGDRQVTARLSSHDDPTTTIRRRPQRVLATERAFG